MDDIESVEIEAPRGEPSHEFDELKCKLEAAGVDVSGLTCKRSYHGDPFKDIVNIPTGSETAISLWQQLRDLSEVTGYSPVLGNFGDAWLEFSYEPGEAQNIIQQAERIDADEWFKMQEPEQIDVDEWFKMQEAVRKLSWDRSFDTSPSTTIGEMSMYGNTVVLFPTKFSWQVPAFSQFPPGKPMNMYSREAAQIRVAILRKWYAEYGAELVVHTSASYELQVSRPPTTKEAAIKLAVEHYLYCQNPITNPEPTAEFLKELAAELLNQHVWYFYWE